MRRQLVDYLEALSLRDATAEITLGGRVFAVRRGRLGDHYRLAALSVGLKLPAGAAGYVAQASGLDLPELSPTAGEIAEAFCTLHDLNAFRGTLPVQWSTAPEANDRPEDYPHRALSSLVANLARAYGWTADHILERVGPEEAVCYLQEAVVAEHAERGFLWEIADLRDRNHRHINYPPLPWAKLQRRRGRPAGPLPEKFRPQGLQFTLPERKKGKGMPNV